jgi:hypothetical protein
LKPGFAVGGVNVRDTGHAAQTRRHIAIPACRCKVRVNEVNAFAFDEATQFRQRSRVDFTARVPCVKLNAALFELASQRRIALGDNQNAMSLRA